MYWGELYLKYINCRVDTILVTLTTIVIDGHVSTGVWRKSGGEVAMPRKAIRVGYVRDIEQHS
jgi:hypothetical protein